MSNFKPVDSDGFQTGAEMAWAVGLGFVYVYARYSHDPEARFPLTFLATDQVLLFALGMGVSALCASGLARIARPVLWVVLGCIGFPVIDAIANMGGLGGCRTIGQGLASSAIILGLVRSEAAGRVLGGGRWMQVLGDASYALYLVHYPLISILCKAAVALGMAKLGLSGAVVSYGVIFLACLAAAVAFHLWMEKPAMSCLRKWAARAGLLGPPPGRVA